DTAADGDGPAPQRRVEELLDRRVERVQVGVKDRRPAGRRHTFDPSRTSVRWPTGADESGHYPTSALVETDARPAGGLLIDGHLRPDPRRRVRRLVLAPRRSLATGARPRRRGTRPAL